jgi:hypothetical protein
MEPVTKILLKNGIHGMIREDEDYFKNNIIQSLSFKLNDALQEASNALKEKVLVSKTTTPDAKSLKIFVEFVNNFKTGKFKFKDETVINITESDIENIKYLFEGLSPKNRIKMTQEVFKSSNNFRQHIEFSKSAKGII